MAQGAKERTDREGGRWKHAHTIFRFTDQMLSLLITVPDFFPVQLYAKKKKSSEKQVGETQELWQCDRRLIIADRY